MQKRKVGRPKKLAKDKKAPLTVMVPAAKKKELREKILQIIKDYVSDSQ